MIQLVYSSLHTQPDHGFTNLQVVGQDTRNGTYGTQP